MAEVVAASPPVAQGNPPPPKIDTGEMIISCDVTTEGRQVDGSRQNVNKESAKRKADDVNLGDDSPPGAAQGMNGKRKRHRRKYKGGGHHRKWKPYDKLSCEEKQMLAVRESKRYVQKRDKRFASGQAMAPYNTTQFLMEQHQMDDEYRFKGEEIPGPHCQHDHYDTVPPAPKMEGSGSPDSCSDEDFYESPSEEQEIFQEKDFSEAYESFHAERLQSMSKDELVREYIALEGKVENLEQRLRDMGENNRDSEGTMQIVSTVTGGDSTPVTSSQQSTSSVSAATNSDSNMQCLIKKLKQENTQLTQENDKLRHDRAAAEVIESVLVGQTAT